LFEAVDEADVLEVDSDVETDASLSELEADLLLLSELLDEITEEEMPADSETWDDVAGLHATHDTSNKTNKQASIDSVNIVFIYDSPIFLSDDANF
jgi:hypothetical protein